MSLGNINPYFLNLAYILVEHDICFARVQTLGCMVHNSKKFYTVSMVSKNLHTVLNIQIEIPEWDRDENPGCGGIKIAYKIRVTVIGH